jgi:selenide, water dikinase
VSTVRLTEYSHGAGCACKLSPDELASFMGGVSNHPAARHPDLVVGVQTTDDAGVFAIGDGRCLVQTVDIFTPVVDEPRQWGRVAAANALSDIYAMGAVPMTALQYLAWPRGKLGFDIAGEVLEGGMEIMAMAGCTVVGGHSIDGPEPTYGFAVTGIADEGSVVTNSGARPGDLLVLTKPLGIGVATTAIKRGKCPASLAAAVIETMTRLNEVAGAAMQHHPVSAATDVTGFGLLGHLREMCLASGVGATVDHRSVPLLPGVGELLAEGMWASGSARNLASIMPFVETSVDDSALKLLADAQTSGGLLVAMPRTSTIGFVAEVPGSAVIGSIGDASGIMVV